MDLYDSRMVSKGYQDYFVHSDEKVKIEGNKSIIPNEFFPKHGDSKCRFSVCKKAISDFKKLHPSPENQIGLILFLVEQACIVADS